MGNLQQRQQKIREKRQKSSRTDYVKEIRSRHPLTLHKREDTLTRYPNQGRVNLVSAEEFDALRDNMSDYGLEYDANTGFFEQFGQLFSTVPMRPLLTRGTNENIAYADQIAYCKNCYLSNTIFTGSENILYSLNVKDSCRNILNSMYVQDHSENIYNSVAVFHSYNIFYSKNIIDSADVWCSSNLQGCQHCVFCDDLENKSYCIHNEQYKKEVYFQKKAECITPEVLLKYENTKPLENLASENCQGQAITKSYDVENGFLVYQLNQGRNVAFTAGADGNENFYDTFFAGSPYGNDYVAMCCAGKGDHYYCSVNINSDNSNIFYSFYLEGCSYCFGCVGLKNKEFCILNKQYTKEDRFKKVDEICSAMEKEGTLGDFFPGQINPYYFNDTAASLIEGINKEQALADGYLWRDEEIKVDIPEWMEVVSVDDLGQYEGQRHPELDSGSPGKTGDAGSKSGMTNNSWWIDPTILKKVIKDEDGNVYRIIKMEYDFLMKYGLPLPREHRFARWKKYFSSLV